MSKIIEIKKGDEFNYFSDETLDFIHDAIRAEIQKGVDFAKIKSPCLLGGFLLKDVPLKDTRLVSVWVSYSGTIDFKSGIVDVGVHRCIVFEGDIPDEVLDEYNESKKLIDND